MAGPGAPEHTDSAFLRRWILWVSAGESVGFLAPTLARWAAYVYWPAAVLPLLAAAGIVAGLLLLCPIGFAQWLELRRHVRRGRRWILGNAVTWCVGLAVFFLWSCRCGSWASRRSWVILIGVAAGILMAVTMAAVTGWVLTRMLRPLPPPAT